MALSVRDQMVLTIAATRYQYLGARDQDVRELLGYSPTRFLQRMNWLLEQPDAERERPSEVRRLRRVRDFRKNEALCGADVIGGWDLSSEVSAARIAVDVPVNPTCPGCAGVWLVAQRVPRGEPEDVCSPRAPQTQKRPPPLSAETASDLLVLRSG